MDTVIAHAPAKVNLVLEVAPLRAGEEKHRLSSLFCTTTLSDTLVFTFESGSQPFKAQISFESADGEEKENGASLGVSFISRDDNTLTKTIAQFEREYGAGFLPTGTLAVQVIKSIPAQAGLGGGSSDAAALLRMLCWLAQVEPLSERSIKVAQAVGADVPFFLHAPKQGFCARMGGYGDELQEAVQKPELHLVLVKPKRGVSTKKAYAAFDELMGEPGASASPSELVAARAASVSPSELAGGSSPHCLPVDKLASALTAGEDATAIARLCTNNLEPVAFELLPAAARVKEELLSLSGVLGATLCGSGSAFFAICERDEDARACVQHFAQQGLWAVAVQT